MKKKITVEMFLLSVLSVGFLSFGNALEVPFSEIIENFMPISSNNDYFTLEMQENEIIETKGVAKWINVKQSIGSEKITLDFPKKPIIKKKDGFFFATTKHEGTEYSFITPLPPKPLDANMFFSLFLDQISKDLTSLEYTISEEKNLKILNLIGFDTVRAEWDEIRIIVTPYNFYSLGVAYPEGKQNDSQTEFLNSFALQQ
jgi:hypothetical protein